MLKNIREVKKQQTQQALATSAVELFLTGGEEAASVSAIAQQAGFSTRTFHNYFSSRDEALLEYLRGIFAHWKAQLDALDDSGHTDAHNQCQVIGSTPGSVVQSLIYDSLLHAEKSAAPVSHIIVLADYLLARSDGEVQEELYSLIDSLAGALTTQFPTLSLLQARVKVLSGFSVGRIAYETARRGGGDVNDPTQMKALLDEGFAALQPW